jgi:ubiquinone/menaquinone biosynthesis C-methylase UbiE
MGPLYHLVDPVDRLDALKEAKRVLRPGGRILAEVTCRHAWVLDATVKRRPPGRPTSLGMTVRHGHIPALYV